MAHNQQAQPGIPVLKPPAEMLCGESAGAHWQDLARCSTAAARKLLSFELASKLCVLPLGVHTLPDSALLIAVFAEPHNAQTLREVKFATGMEIIPEAAPREMLDLAIYAAYRGQGGLAPAAEDANRTASAPLRPHSVLDDQAPIPRLLTAIIDRGIYLAASDVHLEPLENCYRLRYRVHGLLKPDPEFKLLPEIAAQLVRRIKVLANLDTTLTQRPQEGGFSFKQGNWSLRLRVSILPQSYSEKVVLRLLHNSFLDSLCTANANHYQALGLSLLQEQFFRAHLASDRGVILLSGPTGSGKSTLLYVALQELNREWRNIITLEDPVERLIPGVNQIEVCEGGSSWSELTARLLRQDPDAIMLGEIRDRETAHAALNAGISGCLVLSTVHAGNCLEIFSRLGQLGADAHLLAQALRLLVAQRLLARNCALCARPVPVTPALARLFGLTADTPLSASLGCTACEFSGISGRLGVFELLRITAGIRECLLDKAAGVNLTQLEHCARNEGYRPLAVSVREALLRQEISPKSALRSMGIAPEFAGYQ